MKPDRNYLFIFILFVLFPANIFPQELDITSFLKQIESGQKEQVASKIPGLKKNYPSSSSLIYLEGLLTEDGEKAIKIYQTMVDKYPNSKYADDAVYRIYTYFTAIDEPNKAELYLKQLKTEYPGSPYLKLAEKVAFTEKKVIKKREEEQKTSPKVTEKSSDKSYKYTVQAGAFTRRENAINLKNDFDKAGYSSQVKEKSVGGSLFHIVYVGKFKTNEEAKSFLSIINSKFDLEGWVVKLD